MAEVLAEEKERVFAHFPHEISQGIVSYAIDDALLHSRYIFTRMVGKQCFGYCTHCNNYYTIEKLKHKSETECLKCGSLCKVQASNVGRKYLRDEAYFVYYEKSVINTEAITARGITVSRDYSGDYRQVQTVYRVDGMYIFEPGNYDLLERGWGVNQWVKRKERTTEFPFSMSYKDKSVSLTSIIEAVKDTPFQFSMWEEYIHNNGDMVRFFQLYSKYPSIEYVTKAGFGTIIQDKLQGNKTYGVLNWRAGSLTKVLRLTKEELREIRVNRLEMGTQELKYYQFSKRNGSVLRMTELHLLADLASDYNLEKINKLSAAISLKEINRYILKQLNRKDRHYRTAGSVLIAWIDYLEDCEDLGIKIVFPNNLYTAHDRTTTAAKVKADRLLNAQIAMRLPELEIYKFTYEGLLIRPAKDSIELAEEGKALKHCVGNGRYAEAYAKGTSILLLIRKLEEPEKPYYTVEVSGNKIRQAYGFKNCYPNDEVRQFIEEFTKEKLVKPRKTKGENSMSA